MSEGCPQIKPTLERLVQRRRVTLFPRVPRHPWNSRLARQLASARNIARTEAEILKPNTIRLYRFIRSSVPRSAYDPHIWSSLPPQLFVVHRSRYSLLLTSQYRRLAMGSSVSCPTSRNDSSSYIGIPRRGCRHSIRLLSAGNVN